jgi:hypothetical protein
MGQYQRYLLDDNTCYNDYLAYMQRVPRMNSVLGIIRLWRQQ